MTHDDTGADDVQPCSGCGLAIAGGTEACRALFDASLARDALDVRFGRYHRLVVDIYALQHPDPFCLSAKSLMAHLTGLCAEIDHPRHPTLLCSLQQALSGSPKLVKPPLPEPRGALTIADVQDVPDPEAYGDAVARWGAATWQAYAPLHGVARAFVAGVLARG